MYRPFRFIGGLLGLLFLGLAAYGTYRIVTDYKRKNSEMRSPQDYAKYAERAKV